MTTNTAALQERIARILNDEGWTFEGIHEPGEYDECEECRLTVGPIAARIAREVTGEVRKAKAEALREAVEKYAITIPDALGYKVPAVTVEDLLDAATEYETRRSDERR